VVTSRKLETLGRSGVDPSDSRAARVAALDALARRDYATEDMRKKLLDKGFESAVVGALLEQLHKEKLLDDRRYVENFVILHAERGQGPMRVRRDLQKMGLPGPLVEDTVDAYPDWLLHLKKARQKKFGSEPPTDYADRQRQARFLSHRGYTVSQIRLTVGADIDLDTHLMQTAEDI
jgi:regulatory protein